MELLPGLVLRPVVGDRRRASVVGFGPNTAAPIHTHEEEQITVALEGELEFDLAGDLRIMRPGTAVVVPPGIRHGPAAVTSRAPRSTSPPAPDRPSSS